MNPLQKIYHSIEKKFIDFADTIYKKVVSGSPFSKKEWYNGTSELTKEAMFQSMDFGLSGGMYGYKSKADIWEYYLNSPYKAGTLSSRLRESAEEAKRIVEETMRKHLSLKSNWRAITKELTQKGVSIGDLPKYLNNLEKTVKDILGKSKDVDKLLRSARRNSERLKTASLRSSYEKVVKAVESGSQKALEKAMAEAIKQKAIYNNTRIARTETARAYRDAFMRNALDDESITAIKYLLSSAHSVVDQCDYFAQVDGYGLGGGVYPKQYIPMIPVHPQCLCTMQALSIPYDKRKHRFSEERATDKLKILPKSYKEAIIKGDSHTLNSIRGGNLLNIEAHALPKRFVENSTK